MYYSSKIANCPWCQRARDFFDNNNLEYTEVDVAENLDTREKLIAITKKDAFPQFKLNQYYLIGFKQPVFDALLNKIKESKDDNNRKDSKSTT